MSRDGRFFQSSSQCAVETQNQRNIAVARWSRSWFRFSRPQRTPPAPNQQEENWAIERISMGCGPLLC